MKYKFDSTPVMPKGFTCASRNCGIKEGDEDLALFYSETSANAAAVFTRNLVPGAPIIAGREIIKKGKLQAVVVNSRVSNVGTGEEGVRRAYRMGEAAAGPIIFRAHSLGFSGAIFLTRNPYFRNNSAADAVGCY